MNDFGPHYKKMKTQLLCLTTLSTLLLCAGGIAGAAESPAGYFNVRDYGAVGDGKISTARPSARRLTPPLWPEAGQCLFRPELI